MVIQPLALFHLRQSTPCCTPSVPKYTGWSAAVRLLCIPSKYVTAGWHIPNLYHTLGVPGVLNEDSLCEPFYHENELYFRDNKEKRFIIKWMLPLNVNKT